MADSEEFYRSDDFNSSNDQESSDILEELANFSDNDGEKKEKTKRNTKKMMMMYKARMRGNFTVYITHI